MSTTNVLQQLDSVSSNYDYLFKIIMLGNSGVGKSSLILKYADDCFSETSTATMGVDVKVKGVGLGDKRLKLQMWDTAGQERFRSLVFTYYRDADGVVMVYDVTEAESFQAVEKWLKEVDRHGRERVCKLLVGNKADLGSKRVVDYQTGKALADKLNIPFLETSAKQNTNVEQCFVSMATDLKNTADKNTASSLDDSDRPMVLDKPITLPKCWC